MNAINSDHDDFSGFKIPPEKLPNALSSLCLKRCTHRIFKIEAHGIGSRGKSLCEKIGAISGNKQLAAHDHEIASLSLVARSSAIAFRKCSHLDTLHFMTPAETSSDIASSA